MSVRSNSESATSAQRLQRGKSSGKLRFGRDKFMRTNSGDSSAPFHPSASSNSIVSSDGEELTSWRIESHAATAPAQRRSSDGDPVVSTRCASVPAVSGKVQPPEPWACTSLADLEILATIGSHSSNV
jgi:hypothetical protein